MWLLWFSFKTGCQQIRCKRRITSYETPPVKTTPARRIAGRQGPRAHAHTHKSGREHAQMAPSTDAREESLTEEKLKRRKSEEGRKKKKRVS